MPKLKPKMKLGAVVYALVAIGFAIEAIRMVRHDGQWGEVHGWESAALLVVAALAAALMAVGAVTRRGLVGEDGPWICRHGWIVLTAGVAAAFFILLLGTADPMIWPSPAVVFLPHFVRRMHESYYDGVAEAEVEIRAGRGEESPPGP